MFWQANPLRDRRGEGAHFICVKEYLALPLDFERRQPTRMFMRQISSACATAMPLLIAYHVWFEWASFGAGFRPLRLQVIDAETHRWIGEDLTHLIEAFVQWPGQEGSLILAGIRSGFLQVRTEEGVSGLILTDFARFNEHLHPDFKSLQQKGGNARARKFAMKKIAEAAGDRRKILESQGMLGFGSSETTAAEREASIALIMRLDRASGSELRSNDKYDEHVFRLALNVVRTHLPVELDGVESFLIERRNDPEVVKLTERVLERFGAYVDAARKAELLS